MNNSLGKGLVLRLAGKRVGGGLGHEGSRQWPQTGPAWPAGRRRRLGEAGCESEISDHQ